MTAAPDPLDIHGDRSNFDGASASPDSLADDEGQGRPPALPQPADESSAASLPGQGAAEERPDEPLRRALRARFERWLDLMLAGEAPPAGVPEEILNAAAQDAQGGDLYAVEAAMTAMAGEVRLQGRAFKQLADALAPLGGLAARLEAIEAGQAEATDAVRDLADQVQRRDEQEADLLPPAKELLEAVLDLHARLRRGLTLVDAAFSRAPASSRFGWFRGRPSPPSPAIQALVEGYRLTLSRLEAALQQWHIEPLEALGQPFDPDMMAAIEVETTDRADEGIVLEVYRDGYTCQGEVLRPAQVKVARASLPAPAASPASETDDGG